MGKTAARRMKDRHYNEDGLRVHKSETHRQHLKQKRIESALHRCDPTLFYGDEDADL